MSSGALPKAESSIAVSRTGLADAIVEVNCTPDEQVNKEDRFLVFMRLRRAERQRIREEQLARRPHKVRKQLVSSCDVQQPLPLPQSLSKAAAGSATGLVQPGAAAALPAARSFLQPPAACPVQHADRVLRQQRQVSVPEGPSCTGAAASHEAGAAQLAAPPASPAAASQRAVAMAGQRGDAAPTAAPQPSPAGATLAAPSRPGRASASAPAGEARETRSVEATLQEIGRLAELLEAPPQPRGGAAAQAGAAAFGAATTAPSGGAAAGRGSAHVADVLEKHTGITDSPGVVGISERQTSLVEGSIAESDAAGISDRDVRQEWPGGLRVAARPEVNQGWKWDGYFPDPSLLTS